MRYLYGPGTTGISDHPYCNVHDHQAEVLTTGAFVTNYVSVTVTYTWLPELFLVGPITLSSTSTLPMAY